MEVTLPWTNQNQTLYHGTSRENADSILERGVLLEECRPGRDFGLGFYTTTSFNQARNWATLKWGDEDEPTVVAFEVPRNSLGGLESLSFVRAGQDADDFWQFIEYCRAGGKLHGREKCYDLVIGPVSRAGFRESHSDYDQVSFHSDRAITILNVSRRDRRL
jgi:hypothetical protein